jgi:hypothetical protein
MKDLLNDVSSLQLNQEYEKVGAVGFSAKLLPGVRSP